LATKKDQPDFRLYSAALRVFKKIAT